MELARISVCLKFSWWSGVHATASGVASSAAVRNESLTATSVNEFARRVHLVRRVVPAELEDDGTIAESDRPFVRYPAQHYAPRVLNRASGAFSRARSATC